MCQFSGKRTDACAEKDQSIGPYLEERCVEKLLIFDFEKYFIMQNLLSFLPFLVWVDAKWGILLMENWVRYSS